MTTKITNVTITASTQDVTIGTLLAGDVTGHDMDTEPDFSTVLSCFGHAVGEPNAPTGTANSDLNGDGYVNEGDYSLLVTNFGKSGPDVP